MSSKTLLTFILASAVAACGHLGMKENVVVPERVARLVAPVLNSQVEVMTRDVEETETVLGRDLDRVLTDQSSNGTEALAVLRGFYIGEAGGEDVACELVARGKSALPALRYYSTHEVIVPGADISLVRRGEGEFEIVMHRIEAGEQCERER
jgi:hypothetical protein